MYEEYVFEAFEFMNRYSKNNTFEAAKTHDETKESGISSSLLPSGNSFSNVEKKEDITDQVNHLNLSIKSHKEEKGVKDCQVNHEMYLSHSKKASILINQSEHLKQENPKGRQLYESGVHKEKRTIENIEEQPSSTDENLTTMSTVNTKGRFFGHFKWLSMNQKSDESVNYGSAFPGATGVTITAPLIQELEKKGRFFNGLETTQEKTHKTSSEKEYLKLRTHACPDKEMEKLLNDAMQDFDVEHDNQYLFYGRSNAKRGEIKTNPVFDGEFMRHFLNSREMYRNPDIKTLGDSITYFGLSSQLQQLEMSLEDLRRNQKNKEHHEDCFKEIDKEIQKLSFKYHPDKVKNRGGTEKDVERAQKQQTALNSTRTALKLLNSAFMEDIGTDHKFGFYTNLNIESLCNEDEMKSRIYEVIFKIGMISRIKQQNVISEIRKFLIESKRCVDSYLGNTNDFEKHRDLALFHLKCCVKGFKKLCAELKQVKEQCKSEKNDTNMLSLIQKMASESKRDLRLLKSLKKTAKASVNGKYQFFGPTEVMDPYFVLPLVSYTNVILMCNVMRRNASVSDILNKFTSDPHYRDDLCYLFHPYYLASYCSGNKRLEQTVLKIMDKEKLTQQGLKVQISKQEIELEFYKCIEQINDFMNYKFKFEDYNETMPVNLLVLDLNKCMTMMNEFEEKEQEVSKGIKEFQKKTEKMNEKYEKFDKMMEESEELTQKFKERLKQSKKFNEKVSNALLHQI